MIEKMTISDYQEIYDLWLHTPGMGLNTVDDSKVGLEKFLLRNPNTCLVAKINNQIIGTIICGHDGRRGYIYHTCVQKDQQNQGIGGKLVDDCLTALKKEGIIKVALVVFKDNQLGNTFWEQKGFSVRKDLIYRNQSLIEIQRIDT